MSGFEVAGVILAVIPLVLEAFDRSDRAFSAFRTFGRYPKEVLRLQAKFRAQKSIFRNDCIHLLAAVTNDNQRAHDLVRLATQATWDDEEIRETFHQRAAAVSLTLDSCRDIIQEINGVIGGFDAELQGFKSVVLGSGVSQCLTSSGRLLAMTWNLHIQRRAVYGRSHTSQILAVLSVR